MSLARNIRKFRLERNMTQEQLASILGVSAQAVSKWETSETYPDGGLLVSIAGALDVSLDVLFDNKAYSMKDISGLNIRIAREMIGVANELIKEIIEWALPCGNRAG